LVAVTVESVEVLHGALAAVDADDHVVVRLQAEPATLRRRVIAREPAGWSGLDDLLDATTRMAPPVAGLDGVALTLSTEGQRADAVADRIRDAFPGALRRTRSVRRCGYTCETRPGAVPASRARCGAGARRDAGRMPAAIIASAEHEIPARGGTRTTWPGCVPKRCRGVEPRGARHGLRRTQPGEVVGGVT
jgi:hypothetical protein